MQTYPSEREFARTYTIRTHEHPYDLVEEYERVIQAAAEYPNKKSAALSSIVELPRSRIRTWVESGGQPDVVRGIETAESNGWLDVDVTTNTFSALNTLVAGVYSGGSIDERYAPSFSPDEGAVVIVRIRDALSILGTGIQTRADDDPDRATEVLPRSDISVLGRVLAALGAPRGEKTEMMDISLPDYLEDAPDHIRRDFVQIYIWNRGQRPSRSETVQIIENRPQSFRKELGALIEDVAGAPAHVTDDAVRLSAEGAENLRLTRESVR